MDPEERMVMDENGGLRNPAGFREARRHMAEKSRIDQAVWFNEVKEVAIGSYDWCDSDEGEPFRECR